MATFSLFSIHWSFGLVATTVVLVAFGVTFAVAILAILVLILANIFNCCYDFFRNLRHAAREDGLPRTLDDVAPAMVYSNGTAPSGCRPDDNACPICLDELEAGAEVRVLPRCKHTFHRSCIDQWLGVRSEICPLCRDHVVDIEKPCGQISIEISMLAIANDV
uniref:RING-type domain-containing protein n=1 Tax=Ananas comosus var. bracteatus TaxID=296719 RepID=A0A6V7Q4S5_ANACO|nr:unnamed protein product [Ananas comosus var. bracteatus]